MTESWVALRARRVRFLEIGAGAPVIIAAGLGISADFYVDNMRALAHAGFRAITPDLPGFGKTGGPALGSTVAELSAHLAEFAGVLGVGHAGWVGHSIGCQAILYLAARHPELVGSLVLAGPTGGYHKRLRHQTAAIASAAVHEPWRLTRAVLRDYMRLSPFNYVGTWIKCAQDDPLQNAKRVRAPALVLVGTHDRVPPEDLLSGLTKELNAEVVKLAGGNHGLPRDAQADFDQAVIAFLRSRSRS